MSPWKNLTRPESSTGYSSTLCNPEHPFYFYWSKDFEGLNTFRFMGEFPSEIVERAPSMTGIKVRTGIEGDRSHITLTVENNDDSQIFYYLSKSLMDATEILPIGKDSSAARVILTHLGRWQKILKNKGSKLLNLNKQVGLFGELMILDNIFLENLNADEAVACWTGPHGHEQDFEYGTSLVEVKTSRTSSDKKIKISSADQLDTVSGEITLVHQTVGVFENKPPESLSLNQKVQQLNEKISNLSMSALDSFNISLLMYGYEEHPEYHKHHFAPAFRNYYSVEGDFPRIQASDLNDGLIIVSYSILIDSCNNHSISEELALERILSDIDNSTVKPLDISLEALLKSEEGSNLEFKSTLRYCTKENKYNKVLESVVVKTIAAFANTSGGILLIGVDDRKNILGLDNDISTLKSVQANSDGFIQHLTTLLINQFGEAFVLNNLTLSIINGNEKNICMVQVNKASAPVFIEISNKAGVKSKSLYARFGNSSREIPPEEIPEFITSTRKYL